MTRKTNGYCKVRHPHWLSAYWHIRRIEVEGTNRGPQLIIYACQHCGFIHVGHDLRRPERYRRKTLYKVEKLLRKYNWTKHPNFIAKATPELVAYHTTKYAELERYRDHLLKTETIEPFFDFEESHD